MRTVFIRTSRVEKCKNMVEILPRVDNMKGNFSSYKFYLAQTRFQEKTENTFALKRSERLPKFMLCLSWDRAPLDRRNVGYGNEVVAHVRKNAVRAALFDQRLRRH